MSMCFACSIACAWDKPWIAFPVPLIHLMCLGVGLQGGAWSRGRLWDWQRPWGQEWSLICGTSIRSERWEGTGEDSAWLSRCWGGVCVSQAEQCGDKLGKYGEVQMLNWANCHHPPEIGMASCSRAWWHWSRRPPEYFLIYFPLEVWSKAVIAENAA